MLIHTPWIKQLIGDISKKMIEFLLTFNTSMNREFFEVVRQAIHLIPSCLQICEYMFTQMILLQSNTEYSSGSIPAHIDEDNHVNAILTLGNISVGGGSTVYYDGTDSKEKGKEYVSIPFEHGHL